MDKEKVAAYFDALAPSWDSEQIVAGDIINFILDQAGVTEGAKVLDVACGTGVLFPYFLEREVGYVEAVDISRGMTEIALSKAVSPIDVICADIEELPAAGDYDSVIVYNAFPHFPDPAGLVRHLAGFVGPSGRLSIAHSMSLERLKAHHSGSARAVSVEMLPAEALAALMEPYLVVDTIVSDHEKYMVSGVRSQRE